jgi:hypothetical protein
MIGDQDAQDFFEEDEDPAPLFARFDAAPKSRGKGMGKVKPKYEVKVWQEDDWWLARVVGASEGADTSPLNALTQARAIESMARDLVATILDAEETSFEVDLDYVLPDGRADTAIAGITREHDRTLIRAEYQRVKVISAELLRRLADE